MTPHSVRQEKAIQAFQSVFAAAYNRFSASAFDDSWLSLLEYQMQRFLYPRKSQQPHGFFDNKKRHNDIGNSEEHRARNKYRI